MSAYREQATRDDYTEPAKPMPTKPNRTLPALVALVLMLQGPFTCGVLHDVHTATPGHEGVFAATALVALLLSVGTFISLVEGIFPGLSRR